MKKLLLLGTCILFVNLSFSQTRINSFAKVDAITGGLTLSVSQVDEVAGQEFSVGDEIIIMQMQDEVLGSNTSDDDTFGDLSSIANVGVFEIATISSETIGSSFEVGLESTLSNTYNTDASVQIIRLAKYTNHTVPVAGHNTLDWDGEIGGVFAIDVSGILTLGGNIDVSGQGFRGGAVGSGNPSLGNCEEDYRTTDSNFGFKGEGIYRFSNSDSASYLNARGKVLNGGGGGNVLNAGGGGGGNYSAGGQGGPGIDRFAVGFPSCDPVAGGLGGIDLSDEISASRFFMGGGGGGGQQDPGGDATAGLNGGGIIMIKAGTILVSGGDRNIAADGVDVTDVSSIDGGGGAGAGGSILLVVDSWTFGGNDLTVSANGGDGGDSDHNLSHGGGGGGGMGVILISGTAPADAEFITQVDEGEGGSNSNDPGDGSGETGSAIPESGNTSGTVENVDTPLPVDLLYWKAKPIDGKVLLEWATSSEESNEYFSLEKSQNGSDWMLLEMLSGAGTTSEMMRYDFVDSSPFPRTYYRLSQTDYDGTTKMFRTLFAEQAMSATNVIVYPNPSKGEFRLNIMEDDFSIRLIDINGQQLSPNSYRLGSEVVVETSGLSKGVYHLELRLVNQMHYLKVIVED